MTLCNNNDQTWFSDTLTSARPLGGPQNPRLSGSGFNITLRVQQMLMHNKFSFLKEGLPSLKTARAPCMLRSPPNLVIFYTTLKPRHRRTSTIVIESVGKILFWQKKNTNSYLKRYLAPYTVGL